MSDDAQRDDSTPADERVAALERELAELQTTHRAALVRAGLKSEALRAGMIDLDGLKLLDPGSVQVDEHGELQGGPQLMAALKRAKPWLFGLASLGGAFTSSAAAAPPAQQPAARRAQEMSYDEWQSARRELLRRA